VNDYEIDKMIILIKISLDDAIRSLNYTSAKHVRESVLVHLSKSKGYISNLKNLVKKEQDND